MSQASGPLPPKPDYERLKIAVDAWKYIVSVQMHFNDMEMKVRNLYFTILAAAIGAMGVVQGKRLELPYLSLEISVALLVLLATIPISFLFYFIDRHWYHRLLQGAVKQGIAIESQYQLDLPEIQLGSKISEASPVKFKHPIWKYVFFFITEEKFKTGLKIHSDAKVEILYKSVIYSVGFVAVVHALFKGVQFDGQPLFHWFVVSAVYVAKLCAEIWHLMTTASSQ